MDTLKEKYALFFSFKSGTKCLSDKRKLKSSLEKMVKRQGDLFIPESKYDLAHQIKIALDKGYTSFGMAGGDGAFMLFYNYLIQICDSYNASLPKIFVLKCGTGNAISCAVGFNKPLKSLDRIMTGNSIIVKPLNLLSIYSNRDFEKGIEGDLEYGHNWSGGADAKIAETYFFQSLKNLKGYIWAGAKNASSFHKDKYNLQLIVDGNEIWKGDCNMVMAGTQPYYGHNVRALSKAFDDPNKAFFRICNLGVFGLVKNIPSLLLGKDIPNKYIDGKRIKDVLGKHAIVNFLKPTPTQNSGEYRKKQEKVEIILERTIPMYFSK